MRGPLDKESCSVQLVGELGQSSLLQNQEAAEDFLGSSQPSISALVIIPTPLLISVDTGKDKH